MKYQGNQSLKKDYFKFFLNPKKIKKLLEQEEEQKMTLNEISGVDLS
jgi:hypothetical protein